MRVYLVRHGETEWNADGRLQGAADVPLHEHGRQQARDAADALARLVPRDVTIVSSPLERAHDTALAVATVLDVEVHLDERLRERAYGVWEGVTPEERESMWGEEYRRWQDGGDPGIAGFETHGPVAERMSAAIEEWAERAGSELMVFTHGSSARIGTQALLGWTLDHRWIGNLGNTAWTRLERHARGDWTLERHNVTTRTVGSS